MKNKMRNAIQQLLQETTQWDFPFFASTEKKKKILEEKKRYLEKHLQQIKSEAFPTETKLEELWAEAVACAQEPFASLPEKNRMNGFYLQELMHSYGEKLADWIMDHT